MLWRVRGGSLSIRAVSPEGASVRSCMQTCTSACYGARVSKTVQIRDLDEETYRGLSVRAAEAGLSVPEFLRQEAERIARRPSMVEWLHRTERHGAPVRTIDVVTALDEQRGEWPHAGR